MSLARLNPARDENERDIVDALRKRDASVVRISGPGVPDLLVGYQGRTLLLEVKAEKGKLTIAQRAFFDTWLGGPVRVVRCIDDAMRALEL